MPHPAQLPLSGVTVVAVEQAVAAPLATRHLADLGARVIKVEREPGGDFARAYDTTVLGQSSHFIWLNRGKESITLDLKSERGIDVLRALLARADVFVQNLAPGAAERIGLGAESLLADHPRLIVANISGYGPTGPYRHKKAYDLLLQCETGVVSITGTPEEPAKAGIPVADIAAGVYAYSGVLAALYERERTGEGQVVEISMLDALSEWMGYPRYYSTYGGTPPARSGARHAAIAPYGPFATSDGQVFLAVQNEREWGVLCENILGDRGLAADPRFATNTERVANRAALTALIENRLAGRTTSEVETLLDEARIANARMRDVNDAAVHPQLLARDRIRSVGTPEGEVRTLRPPMLNDDRETALGPVPAAGAHTKSIMDWLGFGDDA
ncbi:carnitine dehydratase [Prauserella marina]|uniref:Crotonobetainyl-CoA:carnitine CoA-transferase CaiB n=1 Tax=Prauserella marina TaxID=530584 RepID=A0A222VTJ2_9PSEU|nr:CoA transferase [Prauserella marina]ASR37255.1 carnitine dehydratase [Prauserella marina]PWV72584.1 crotonobetainyl-CoA:carnitine CoA-transferase CaiB-like acyl-CoA transferase [Prauserella marina]SDD76601.1 Crotonobetainyl-CoA:carnitine CoA-transferase CaiB [Prauserella marina]